MSAAHLTQDQIQKYKQAFALFDKNGDKKINASELGSLFRSVGLHYSDSEIQSHLKIVDANHNGTLELQELLELMAAVGSPDDSHVRDTFKTFDKNGDGKLNKAELKQMMISLGENVTEELLDSMMKEADKDGNGTIDIDEFVRIMSN